MQIRKSHRIIAAFLSLALVIGLLPATVFAKAAGDDGSAEMNEAYAAKESLMPVGPSFNVDTLLEWTPESDPDAIYSRASIKLTDRVGGFVVNPVANPEAKLMLCTMPNLDHDNANAQGSESFFTYAFNYWQYTDSFVYWSGSEEGLICCPTGEFIDAAHTNGVPVVATLGFPWGSGSGYAEQVAKFCQKAEDGSFPVADKLIEVMDYYGFDGYFFNQESYGCSQQTAELMNEMMRYMHTKRPDMLISWYDSMINTGSVSYRDSVDSSNKMWMEADENGVWGVDEFFMNYNWTSSKISTTISTLKSIGRSQYDAFAGFNVQSNVYGDRLNDHLLVDEDGIAKISLALYYAGQTLSLASNGEEFHETERAYYVNADGDPRVNNVDVTNSTVTTWAGMSRFFADKTPVTSAPFVTDFNTGHGKSYFIDGVKLRDAEWSYQSNQDVLPTWTWIIDSEGEKLSGGYDFDDAYNGGSSVKFSGNLTGGKANDIMLYSTGVAVESGMKLGLTYKGDQGYMKLVAYYGDASTASYEACEQVVYDLTAGTGDWTTTEVDISAKVGKTLYAIGLKIESESDVTDYQVNLGRLTVTDKTRSALNGPASVTLDEILYADAYTAEARVYWKAVTGASSYEIYKVNSDGSKTLIMETPNTAYYIPALERVADETDVTLEIVAINRNGVRGKGTTLTIDWAYGNDDTEKIVITDFENVCLTATVTGYSEQGDGAECDKAIDGSYTTKWWASGAGDWMSIDLGQPRTIKRWLVGHGGAGGEGEGMNHRSVSLFYKDATGAWVEAKRIDNNYADITDVLLDTPITAQEWKLVVNRIGSSPWGAVNIYEWQMFETDQFPQTTPVPMQFASAFNGVGAADTFTLTNVPDGLTVKLYTKTTDGYTEIGTGQPTNGTVSLSDLNFGTADAGRVYYTTTASSAQESAKLSASFEAENAEKSAAAENVSFVKYSRAGSVSSSSGDGIYTTLTVSDLNPGDVVYVYENGSDSAYTKASLPVSEGATTVSVDAVFVTRAGGTLALQVKRTGKLISDVYTVETPAFADPTATVVVYASNADGETLTGVQFALIGSDGEDAAQLSTTSDSGGKATVALDTYTLKCLSVPEGYKLPDDLTKLVTIEGWAYEVNVTVAIDDGTTDPTDPVDPEEPVLGTENVALSAEVIAYNGNNLGGSAGPEKLFDGAMSDADNDKWCENGNNKWIAFDIGSDRQVTSLKLYHAGANNEWSSTPGGINTEAYEFYVLNTDKISVEDLLAKSYEERCTLLDDASYWTLVASRTGNKEDITTDALSNVTGRIFKINVSDTDSNDWAPCVRLYELELYSEKAATPLYTITVSDEIVGGTVTADKNETEAGETVSLTVTPDEGYYLVEGSVKVNGAAIEGLTFTMPEENVVITAKFISEHDLIQAAIKAAKEAAEKAQKAAEEAAAKAEEAQKAAEEAAASAAENKEAAEKAQKAAEEAKAKAEEAKVKAEEAAKAAEEANAKAAEEAAKAAEEAANAASAAALSAQAQQKAQEAQAAAEEAQKAAEEAAASSAENKEAAEKAQKAAEDAKAAAEEAAKAADESRLDAVDSAAEAAKSAVKAAEAAKAAQEAQEAAEASAKVAEEAKSAAEEAQKKAEEAAANAGADSDAALDAARRAKAAQEAAEEAQKAAEEAQKAAEAAMTAAEASNQEAAESAAQAAEYAKLSAEAYAEIVKMKAQMIEYLNEAILAAEQAKKAELALAKSYALVTLSHVDTDGLSAEQAEAINAIIAEAAAAIEEAKTSEEVEAILAAALEAIEEASAKVCAADVFTDVNKDAWYHESVDFMVNNGYMNGTGTDVFGTYDSLTRAQLVTILYRIAGSPSVEGQTHPFADVADGRYYTNAVIWAYNAGIVNGVSETAFDPAAEITRMQIATILYRYDGSNKVEEDHLADYADASNVPGYAVDGMNWAVANGIINGVISGEETILAPRDNATRAEIAAIIHRYLTK